MRGLARAGVDYVKAIGLQVRGRLERYLPLTRALTAAEERAPLHEGAAIIADGYVEVEASTFAIALKRAAEDLGETFADDWQLGDHAILDIFVSKDRR